MNYFLGFSIALALSLGLTPLVKRLAFRIGAVDQPGEARKIHDRPIARLGGLAIFAAFVVSILIFLPLTRHLGALLLAIIVLVIVGVIDDIRGLSPWVKLWWQIGAACIALAGGIGIYELTNPFGGVVSLSWGRFDVTMLGTHFHITPVANILSIVWMVGVINVVNFLDGLDGLACGVSSIAALIMFILSVGIDQPETAMIAIILAGAALGFLPFNFFPARIFMGDSGSYFLGLTLAMIAIYSGGKLATAGLVLGFTIIDGMWAVMRRLWARRSPFAADRGHLHHMLLDAGLSQRTAVLLLYTFSIVFGVIALLSGSFEKLIGAGALLIVMAVLITSLLAASVRKTKVR